MFFKEIIIFLISWILVSKLFNYFFYKWFYIKYKKLDLNRVFLSNINVNIIEFKICL